MVTEVRRKRKTEIITKSPEDYKKLLPTELKTTLVFLKIFPPEIPKMRKKVSEQPLSPQGRQ